MQYKLNSWYGATSKLPLNQNIGSGDFFLWLNQKVGTCTLGQVKYVFVGTRNNEYMHTGWCMYSLLKVQILKQVLVPVYWFRWSKIGLDVVQHT